MNDPRTSKPDAPPSAARDTSREGREEEVINQQQGDTITNSDASIVVNGVGSTKENAGEQQFKEGTFDHSVKMDIDKENLEGSDRTGNEESGLPGSGI